VVGKESFIFYSHSNLVMFKSPRLMHSEDLERNMKLWEGGGQPPENNGGSSSHETNDKDDDNQTTTVREIPPSPAALKGLTVAGLTSAAAANDEIDSEIGDGGGGGGLPEEDWKTAATAEEEVWAAANSRIFSHEVGGSQKRSLVPDLPAGGGDGGRRNLGLSIFAGYMQAEEEEAGCALRSAHNKVSFTSLICKDDDVVLSFIKILSCYAQSINLLVFLMLRTVAF
jgi:hypothetical protein